MPLDPSIPLSGEKVPFNNPFTQLGQLGQLRAQQQEGQLRQQQLVSGQQAQQEQAIKLAAAQKSAAGDTLQAQLMQQHRTTDPDTGLSHTDHQGVYDGLVAAGQADRASLYMASAKNDEANKNAIAISQLDTAHRVMQWSGDLADSVLAAPPEQQAEAYRNARLQMGSVFPDKLASMPAEYPGPDAMRQMQQLGQTHEGRLKDALTQAQTGEATGKGAESQAQAKQAALVTAGTSPTGITAEQQATNTAASRTADIAAGRLAEEHRSNLAKEATAAAAANPFGMPGQPGAVPQPAPGPPQAVPGVVQGQRPAVVPAVAQGPPGGQPAAAQGGPPQRPTGDAFLATIPPGMATEVKMYTEGRKPWPTGRVLDTPYFQQLSSAIGQYDPSVDFSTFAGRNKMRSDLSSTKAGTGGGTIISINQALAHLDGLVQKGDALHNMGSVGTLANAPINAFESNVLGDSRVKNFNLQKTALTEELVRAWRGSGGNESDIKAYADNISPNNSPAQNHGTAATIAGLLEGKTAPMEMQRDQIMGPHGQDIQIVTPQSRVILDKLQGRTATAGSPQASAATGMIRARDPQGQLHEAKAGTPLPEGWKAEP